MAAGGGHLGLLRTAYAAAAGGTPDQWAGLEEAFVREAHTVVLVTPMRLYPATG